MFQYKVNIYYNYSLTLKSLRRANIMEDKKAKKPLTKEDLINSLLEVNSSNIEWSKHFTKDRLKRGFTVGMLTYLLNNQITKKEVI